MLTLLVVTKNSEEELPRLLTAAKLLVDEIIVVDQDSTDKTKKVAAEFGAKILDAKEDPWNEGLKEATMDWVLALAPHEVIFKQDMLKLRKFLPDAKAVGYMFSTRHYTNNAQLAGWKPTELEGYSGYVEDARIRLIKHNGIVFDKDTLEKSVKASRGLVQHIDDVPVHDYGYDHNRKDLVGELEKKQDTLADKYNLAVSYMNIGEYAKAVNKFLEVSKENAEYRYTLRNLGTLYLKAGRFEQAGELLQKALKQDPKDVTAYNNLGVVFKQLEQYDQAAACFSEASKLSPKDPRPIRALARVYKLKGDTEKAKDLIEKALKVFPNDDMLKSELS